LWYLPTSSTNKKSDGANLTGNTCRRRYGDVPAIN